MITLLGQEIEVSRRGTDGDLVRFAQMFRDLDGKVDALGVGGADLYVRVGDRQYAFRQIQKIVDQVKTTPVVDGSGLKHTLERAAVHLLQKEGIVDFRARTTLLVSSVDRFGMAQALHEIGGRVIYGDLLFGLGLPIPIRSYAGVEKLGRLLLPIITRVPIQWIYPTGSKQETRTPKFTKYFDQAEIIAGDWHYIRRFAPDRLAGKTVITQTLRQADLDWLKTTGLKRAITTTPEVKGESFATNVMEAALVAISGQTKEQLASGGYEKLLAEAKWRPNVFVLN